MSADTGVGPSMASNSQPCSGNCADLPQAASSKNRPIAVAQPESTAPIIEFTASKRTVPTCARNEPIAKIMPRSPTRFMMNALLPAAAAEGLCCQKPISR